jgi:asparagine synthase (glutamine-hydrolysing)
MSAICGLIHLDGRPIAPADLVLMNEALSACGPDGDGIWTGGNVGLGQRLARVTPEDDWERQPAFSKDRCRVLVSDARIDNRPELAEEFGIRSAEMRELPDSAFILRAFEKWGDDCAAHLVGAFAFALYDVRERRVLIARSPMAERTLFYFQSPGLLAFSSAPRGLFALPFVPRAIDRRSIADFLVFSANEPGTSWFSGISRLKAGHRIVVHGERFRSEPCREIDVNREIRFRRDSDYVETFNDLLDRVVADQLRSRTPVGIRLSGGLDSSTIAASAALTLKRDGKLLHGFTAVPPADFTGTVGRGWYADETPYVEAMSRRYDNIDIHLVRPDGSSYLDHLTRFFKAAESPLLGAGHLAWTSALQREARKIDARVLLTGTPGNFTISYDGQGLLPNLSREGKWAQALRQVRALNGSRGFRQALRTAVGSGVMPLLPNRLWIAAERLRGRGFPGYAGYPFWRIAAPIHPEFARSQRIDERVRSLISLLRSGCQPHSRGMAILWRADRRADLRRGEEIMYGVQNRDLPADIRLVEFCLSLPESQYLRGGTSRWLIRRAAAGRLPEEIRDNQRRGLQFADWFESLRAASRRLRDELAQIAESPLANEMVDVARLRRLVEHLPENQKDGERVQLEYRTVLESGIAMGRFLMWIEGRA